MLYLGADHNGFKLKEQLKVFFVSNHIPFVDCGAKSYSKADDYVDYAVLVTRSMKKGDAGLLVCGSGHGMVIAANKVKGVRAILADSPQSAVFGRRDDHANILVLAAWLVSFPSAKRIVAAYLRAKPGRSVRYLRRLRKVKQLER